MDACTYESITGLKNYYGFKSLLKNGGWTQRYSCDDDTIVFNYIKSYPQGVINLAANQVAVVLNASSNYYAISATQWAPDAIYSKDVANNTVKFIPDQNVIGMCLTQQIIVGTGSALSNLVIAVFDLY
jgi:hypothetical protein